MAADTSFVNYTGNAGLGLGGSADIPAIGTATLEGVNDLGKNLLAYDASRNLNIFNQKVKDRDKLLEMIDQDKVGPTDVLEQDQKLVDDSINSVTDAYTDMIKAGGINNAEAYRDYKKKVYAAKNVSSQAAYRKIQHDLQKQQQTASTLDSERKAIQGNMDKWLPNFWGDATPFQKATSLDHKGLFDFQTENALVGDNGQPLSTTTTKATTGPKGTTVSTTTAPVAGAKGKGVAGVGTVQVAGADYGQKGFSVYDEVPGTYVSFDNIRRNSLDGFAHEPQRMQDMAKQVEMFQTMPPQDFQNNIALANDKLKQYNEFRGLKPGDKDYAAPFDPNADFVIDSQTGQRHVNMSTPEFSAKLALAQMPSYGSKGGVVFNEKKAAHEIAHQRLDLDEFYKKGMLANAREKTGAYVANLRQQMKYRKDEKEQNDMLDDLYIRNIVGQTDLLSRVGSVQGNKIGAFGNAETKIEANTSLPVFTINKGAATQLVPIDAKPVYSDDAYKVVKGKKELKENAKPDHYEGGYYKQSYQFGNTNATIKDIKAAYETYKASNPSYEKDLNGFMKDAIQSRALKVSLQGANGKTDEQLSRAAQRLISNKGTKKGQQGVFDNRDEPPTDETVTTEESSYGNERADNQQ